MSRRGARLSLVGSGRRSYARPEGEASIATLEHPATAVTREASAVLARGDWTGARDLLLAAQRRAALGPAELDLLARAAYGAGDLERAIAAWEELHRVAADAGDVTAAASAAATVATYLMMDTGLMAPVRGWTARAERLLAGQPEGPVHAWIAMVRTYERLLSGDVDGAREQARRAVDVGTRHGEPAPVAIGRVATARILILDGHVPDGLALLDEAAVAVVSGELDPLATGMVYCELVCAMQGLAQYDRAEQWTEAMSRWQPGNAFGGINGRCRVHRAEMLRLRGTCEEAEAEALHACDELRPWMRREFGWPLTELGTIRLRRGDLAGAEQAFLEAHGHGWDPEPGLALLRLEQGDVAAAVASVRRALEHPVRVPSKERPPYGALPRAPLLAAQVEIAVAADDLDTARIAAAELRTIADRFRSRALTASVAAATGRVALAADDPTAALDALAEALVGWTEVDAPYETAVVRQLLAEAARACGDHERARLELAAAASTFTRLGAERRARQAEAALAGWGRPGAVPAAPEVVSTGASGDTTAPAPARAPNVFRCDGDTRTVSFAGETVLLRDLKGMRYLEQLLCAPGREFHVLDLLAAEHHVPGSARAVDHGALPGTDGDAGPVLDETAKAAYRRRLAEIDEDLAEADRFGDEERAALARADRDYLVRELSRAFGLGGAPRRSVDQAERARGSVSRALRYAVARIAEHHPVLGTHLRATVATGTYCGYRPDPRVDARWSC